MHRRAAARVAQPGAGCAFSPGTLFALRLVHGDGVTAVTAQGRRPSLRRPPLAGARERDRVRYHGALRVPAAGHDLNLIAPDELSGRIWAIAPTGATALVARPPIPHGQDVGVESAGFVPAGAAAALVADRGMRRNRHPGDDLILRLTTGALRIAGVRPGDRLVVAEGGARTAAIACRPACQARIVAGGPPEAHVEGHVVFVPTARR